MSKGSICIYGRTKIGKTSDAVYAFRDSHVICTEPEALAPVKHQFGFCPAHTELLGSENPYEDMLSIIRNNVAPGVSSGEYKAVILDSGTAFGAYLFRRLERKFRGDGRRLYPAFDHQFKDVLMQLLMLPCWVICLFHEQEPRAEETSYVRGGPRSGGSRKLVEDIGGMFRLVMRAAGVQGGRGLERAYLCDSLDPQWVQGDAYGATANIQPMDLRPIVFRILRPGVEVPEMAPKPYRVVEGVGNGASLFDA